MYTVRYFLFIYKAGAVEVCIWLFLISTAFYQFQYIDPIIYPILDDAYCICPFFHITACM